MQEENGNLDSGILRTTRAFKKQIEVKNSSEVKASPVIWEWKVLEPLCVLRKSLREVCEELGPDSVTLDLVEDDEFGWPRLTLKSVHGKDSFVRLVVGAQDRRNGTVLLFKIDPSDLRLELSEKDYMDGENLQRVLRLYLRSFFDEVSKLIEKQKLEDEKLSNVFDSLSQSKVYEGDIEKADLASGALFSDGAMVTDACLDEGDEILMEEEDFFK